MILVDGLVVIHGPRSIMLALCRHLERLRRRVHVPPVVQTESPGALEAAIGVDPLGQSLMVS